MPLDPLIRLGFFFGAAFQIQDDLLNLEPGPRVQGKEVNGDLFEGKRTLMMRQALREAPEGGTRHIDGVPGPPARGANRGGGGLGYVRCSTAQARLSTPEPSRRHWPARRYANSIRISPARPTVAIGGSCAACSCGYCGACIEAKGAR